MKSIEDIRNQISSGNYELSAHALKRAIERKIMYFEIEEAGNNLCIIEDYPDDKYTPSCLLLGFTKSGKPIHLLVSRANLDYTKIITVYFPDELVFKDFKERL